MRNKALIVRESNSVNSAVIERLEDRQLLSVSPALAKAPPLKTHGQVVQALEGAAFPLATLVTFTDPTPDAASQYSAQVTWGDGTPAEAVSVASDGAGGFVVVGSHAFTKVGAFHPKVQITDADGSAGTALATVKVQDAPLTANGIALNATKNSPFQGVVATFIDADPNAVAGAKPTETASINWGDGVVSAGTITQDTSTGVFTVTGKHTYGTAKLFNVVTTIHDKGGAKTSASASGLVVGPQPTENPSLVGDFKGKIKLGGLASLAGSQSFELNITDQTLTSITGSLILDGGTVKSGTFQTDAATGSVGELSNGNFKFELSDSGYTIQISGHISPDGKTITNGFADATGPGFKDFHGGYTLTLQ